MTGRQGAAIGIDVGGTKVAAGLVASDGDVLDSRTVPTPVADGVEAVLQTVIAQVDDLRRAQPQADVLAVGIGTTGMVDTTCGVIIHADGNLAEWEGMRVRDSVSSAVGLPVFVDNDVNALAIGEGRFGAGRGWSEILYVAVGTGIGGALVRGGGIWRGAHYNAGEVGYLVARWDEAGRPVKIEDCASGPAMAMQYQLLSGGAGPGSLRQIAIQARAGDELAVRVITEGARLLAQVLGPVVGVLDPEILIVGGGVPEIGALWWRPFEQALRDSALPALQHVRLARAQLSTHAGMIGAAALALNALDRREPPERV